MDIEWKPGDRAMVVVDHSGGPDGVVLRVPGGHWVPFECLHPLPAPDPLTELERTVLDAAILWRQPTYQSVLQMVPALANAVDALIAARAPKDPVAELRAARAAWLDADPASQEFAHAQESMLAAVDRVIALEAGK